MHYPYQAFLPVQDTFVNLRTIQACNKPSQENQDKLQNQGINVGENDTIETIASQEKDSDRKDYSDEDKLLVLLGQGRISVAEYKRLTEKKK